jgi:RNA polymerase sigma-70 factor, ECF subfamily
MDQSTLSNLIECSVHHDDKAFRKLVEGYQPKVYALAFRILCNQEEAKDVVQETFIRVWMNLSSYDRDKKFSTWLYAIATNLCFDKLKSSRYNHQTVRMDEFLYNVVSSEDIEQKIIDSELGDLILGLTEKLTSKQRIVFTLRDLEGLEVEEIVQVTGLSANKIKSNLFLARQSIRNKLKNL